MSPRTWFITGSSHGFGREWAIAALEPGDAVAATARNISSLDDLVERFGERILPLTLDVPDRAAVSTPSRRRTPGSGGWT
jgi:NADP-dependent 3-hydroxy acid dehydrogenase YdfG